MGAVVANEFEKYIGLPWRKDAVGPDAFNCGTFMRHIQLEHFGRVVPVSFVNEDQLLQVARVIRGAIEKALGNGWVEVSGPCHGDVVFMAHVNHPTHVGVWLDVDGGGVIHCARGMGVVFSNFTNLRLAGWGNLTFYHYESCDNSRT